MKADIFSDPQDKEQISKLKLAIEIKNDFIQWLFDESGELNHTSINEQWDKFEKWQESKEICPKCGKELGEPEPSKIA